MQNDGAGGKLTSDVSYLLVSWPSAAPYGWQNTPFHKMAKNIPYPAGIQRSRIGVVSHFRRSEGGQRYGR